MIRLDSTQITAPTRTPGSVYHVRVGDTALLPTQTRALWQFLGEAMDQPLGLILDPFASPPVPTLAHLNTAEPNGDVCHRSFLHLFSSGTTGQPKGTSHDLLDTFERTRSGPAEAVWLLAYTPFVWAGLSILLHVLKSNATLVVPETLKPEDLLSAAVDGTASHLSLIPSYLRHLELCLGREMLQEIPLTQLTFGGEAATQPVLDLARTLWPRARVTHVYATTETGDVCAVSDGKEGIPAAKFNRPSFTFTADGELVANGHATGDLWKLCADRYIFQGRRCEMINVGGQKVSPIEVEKAATGITGVTNARAYAVSSPLLGQLVALDYCGSIDEKPLRQALSAILPKVARPASITRKNQLPLTAAGKTQRT